MDVSEKYPLLIGHSLAGRTRLRNIQEVANFICTHGQYGDLTITQTDGTPFLDTFGIYRRAPPRRKTFITRTLYRRRYFGYSARRRKGGVGEREQYMDAHYISPPRGRGTARI